MERTQGWQEGAAPQGAPHELTPHGRFRAVTLAMVGAVVCFAAVVWSGKAWAFDQGVAGQVITESVTLTQDVTAPVGVNGIMIDADDVVLDGGGHLISGPVGSADTYGPPYGIYITPNRRGVVVKNVRVTGFNNCILLDVGAQSCVVENCVVTGSRWNGIALLGGSDNIVRNCTSSGHGPGTPDGRGIKLLNQPHHGTLIEGNLVENNGRLGIGLWADGTEPSTGVIIRNNTVRDNGGPGQGIGGIHLAGATGHVGTVVEGNTVTGNYIGVLVTSSQSALVQGNTITGSGDTGLWVGGAAEGACATDTVIAMNSVCDSTGYDIGVDSILASGTQGNSNTCNYAWNFSDTGSDGCANCCSPAAGDTTPPTTPIVNDGLFATSLNSLEASWDATDPESGILEFQYAVGTSPGAQDVRPWRSALSNRSAQASMFTLAEGGTYYWSVRARNGACLWSDVGVSDGVTVDTLPPTGTVTSPSPGQTVRGILTLRVSASDATSGVSMVQLWALNRGWNLTSPPYEVALDTRGATVPEGANSLTAILTDGAGNGVYLDTVPFVVDNTTFDDVIKGTTFWRYVEGLVDATVTSGCNASPPLYCPTKLLTRSQMAKFLSTAAGKTWLDATTPTFADVPRGSAFYGWIERLADLASWGGNPPTSGCKKVGATRYFCPDENATRAQMAKFLCVARGKTWLDAATPTFADVPKTHLFYGWIERLADPAFWGGTAPTSGCTATKYCPDASVRRDQMAKFLVLAFGLPYYQG